MIGAGDRPVERLWELALAGLPGLGRPEDVARDEDRARPLVARYTALSAATGFACGLPGYGLAPLTIPTDLAGVLVLQLHMSAALACLYGHDPRDPAVRAACIRSVLGGSDDDGRDDDGRDDDGADASEEQDAPAAAREAVPAGRERSTPGKVDRLLARVAGKLGERGARFLGEQAPRLAGRGARSLPLLGGAIGAVADARSTADAGLRARRRLRALRAL